MICIYLLKLRGDYILKPIEIIFKNYLKEGIFPDKWKKVNVAKIHDKKMINKSYLIMDVFLSFQFVARYLKVLYIIQ